MFFLIPKVFLSGVLLYCFGNTDVLCFYSVQKDFVTLVWAFFEASLCFFDNIQSTFSHIGKKSYKK